MPEGPIKNDHTFDMGEGEGEDDEEGREIVSQRVNSGLPEAVRTLHDEQQNESPSVDFQDHFSLHIPSSVLRRRGGSVYLYEQRSKQIQLEATSDDIRTDGRSTVSAGNRRRITVKMANTGSVGLNFLRGTYTMVTILMAGFLLIFCLFVILNLFLEMTIQVGYTSLAPRPNWIVFVSTLLSVPLFVYGLANAMTLAVAFVADTWGRHTLMRTLGSLSSAVTEWVCFVVFLGIPVITICITLLLNMDNWWEISSLVWFFSALGFYLLFALSVGIYEIISCLRLVRKLDYNNDPEIRIWSLVAKSILRRQSHLLSGVRKAMFLVQGDTLEPAVGSYTLSSDYEPFREKMSLYTKMTLMPCCTCHGKFFHTLYPPERIYTIEDVLEVTPFMTANTWSLEKIYCGRNRDAKSLSVVKGRNALLPNQLRSSIACALLGNAIALLLVVSFLLWLEFATGVVIALGILMGLCFISPTRTTCQLYGMYSDILDMGNGPDAKDIDEGIETGEKSDARKKMKELPQKVKGDAKKFQERLEVGGEKELVEKLRSHHQPEGVCQVWEEFRVTRPTNALCWISFVLQVLLFFLWPLVHLFLVGNVALALLFLGIGLISGTRYFLNASLVFRALGSMDIVDDIGSSSKHGEHPCDTDAPRSDEWHWRAKARLSQVMGTLSRGRGKNFWIGTLLVFVFLFFVLALSAIQTPDTTEGNTPDQPLFAQDFYYNQTDDLAYPTCVMRKGMNLPNRTSSDLSDYAFLSKLAYSDRSYAQTLLDGWFGDDFAIDREDIVQEFRDSRFDVSSPVSYKLTTFRDVDGLGVVSIRGTQNAWDAFADAQIWAPAFLAQVLRFVLPGGEIWTPMLDTIVRIVAGIGKHGVASVSYYKETSDFVEYLRSAKGFSNVQVTGHSLGGGLAIITGAQTGARAVALSGVNAMLSRQTFDPPVSAQALNTMVFNIVPDRDPVAHVDDVADLNQRIQCRAPVNDPFDCHTSTRSLCDILFHCGTGPRPALCQCSQLYGYPEPMRKEGTTKTFAEVCPPLTDSE